MTDTWAWEYDPDPGFVIGGIDNLAFVAQVEQRADELVRAAAALYLDGAKYMGGSPRMQEETVDASGMFVYQVVPRHQRVYIRQVTFLGL
ncbi:hypothetical protein [Streptomyces albireticuli]|uniref:Uncharacterized protein n=1 Tax=Streptomyces albireticuli TaxID=1940 RepID=A0A2A2DFW5_9ACTN|nr:hypothetical protein [Streptomyces albireticuli]MCD9141099.1 hypothetical protein [Streptomyces albireticuli]MCD9160940.1 hypothetical protein [Streptomyces albireticuli]MCD9191003.1 hypothetical protein [Streptomyces albireticuli]PAU50220.1 hypothetical protein CK936_03750 [Streptomyces albireticuli]